MNRQRQQQAPRRIMSLRLIAGGQVKRVMLVVVLMAFSMAACADKKGPTRLRLKWRPDIGAGVYELQGVNAREGAAWSPDGKTIATLWDTMPYPDFCLACDVGTELSVIDTKTLVKTPLIKADNRHINSMAWLPDSTHIAYRDYSSGELRFIGIDGVDDGKLMELSGVPVWRPDGSLIAVRRSMGGPGNWYPVMDIYDAKGGKLYTAFKCDIKFGHLSVPSWSPDGKQLAYACGDFGMNKEAALPPIAQVLDLSTGQVTQLGKPGVEYWDVQFAPVGEVIALWGLGSGERILLEDLMSGCTAIIPIDWPGNASWSPDARRMVVSSGVVTYLVNLNELLGEKFALTGSICK